MHYANRIEEIDEGSRIVVWASGRAFVYLTTFALLLGLHIRVGMENTLWRWPYQDEMIKSRNLLGDQANRRIAWSRDHTGSQIPKDIGNEKPEVTSRTAR